MELVEVYQTADALLLPVVKSVLEEAGIDYVVLGDSGLSLYPLGSVGMRADHHQLEASVRVAREDVPAAREILRQLPQRLDDA